MRYESIPRKIINSIVSTFKYMRSEFGIWAYAIIAFLGFMLYNPVKKFLETSSDILLYIVIFLVVLFIARGLFRKLIK